MNTPVLTFFNNKGGVGKTSLIYHLAWIYASLDKRVIAVDIDPQANLTAAFLSEDEIATLWERPTEASTIYQIVKPLTETGSINKPDVRKITENLALIPGDVELSGFEEVLSDEWPKALSDRNLFRPMTILSSFWQIMVSAVDMMETDLILVDVGPNLGAINRSALLATDYVVIPLGADLFSLQGLKNLGPTLKSWKTMWQKRLDNWTDSQNEKNYPEFRLPEGKIQPIGYLCQQHGVRLTRPVQAYDKWVNRIPELYRQVVTEEEPASAIKPTDDPHCLATIKHYRSLIPMAQEHRKPIFNLKPADGAIGSHAHAVASARKDFTELAQKIADKIGLDI